MIKMNRGDMKVGMGNGYNEGGEKGPDGNDKAEGGGVTKG